MSCGCGCNDTSNGCGGHSKRMVQVHGQMQVGSFGPPPIGSWLASGMNGLGLGDTCIDWDTNGNCISTVSDPTSQVSQVPTESPYPVVTTPTTNPAATPAASSSNSNLLNSLAASWSAAAQSILKAQAGANPTLVTTNPNGASTTYYGSSANMPTSLSTSLTSLTSSSGSLIIMGIAAIALFMMMGSGRR